MKLKERRGAYIVSRPNRVWSIDGYCKLAEFGIEIYGNIDACARNVLWVYVGLSAFLSVSVGCQYLDMAEFGGIIPVLIRSDRGMETPIAADLHHRLQIEASPEPVEFKDYWKFGKSTANIRIESWWEEVCKSKLGQ